jgi:hypothetical protein
MEKLLSWQLMIRFKREWKNKSFQILVFLFEILSHIHFFLNKNDSSLYGENPLFIVEQQKGVNLKRITSKFEIATKISLHIYQVKF